MDSIASSQDDFLTFSDDDEEGEKGESMFPGVPHFQPQAKLPSVRVQADLSPASEARPASIPEQTVISDSQESSEVDSDDGNEILLFDQFDEEDEDDAEAMHEGFWLSQASQSFSTSNNNEESFSSEPSSDNEGMLFDDLSDDDDAEEDFLFRSQSHSQSQSRHSTQQPPEDADDRDIGNDELREIIAEGEAYMPNITANMTPAERRERVRKKLAYIVTGLLSQLVLSTTIDPTLSDNQEDEKDSSNAKGPECVPLTLSIATREIKGDRKRKRPKMPQFPSDNKGSGAKRFAMILRVIDLVDEALSHNKIITLRDLYYRDKALFGTQMNANRIVDDLAAQLKIRRRDLNIIAAAKGLVFGHLTFKMSSGEYIDCATNPAGSLIPTAEDMTDLDISDQLRFVLVIEKEAIFRSLATASFHRDDVLGHSVLITGKGYPDIVSRELVHTLCLHLPENIPTLALVDGDPHGLSIYLTYRDGSSAMEHERESLIAPRLRWLGVTAGDMQESGIDSDYLLPINETDVKHAEKLLSKTGTDVAIKSELRHILRTRQKAEIQILTSTDPDGLIKYLRRKIPQYLQ